jgi:hypothetical protein
MPNTHADNHYRKFHPQFNYTSINFSNLTTYYPPNCSNCSLSSLVPRIKVSNSMHSSCTSLKLSLCSTGLSYVDLNAKCILIDWERIHTFWQHLYFYNFQNKCILFVFQMFVTWSWSMDQLSFTSNVTLAIIS